MFRKLSKIKQMVADHFSNKIVCNSIKDLKKFEEFCNSKIVNPRIYIHLSLPSDASATVIENNTNTIAKYEIISKYNAHLNIFFFVVTRFLH